MTDKEARRLQNHPSKELKSAMNWRPNVKIDLLIGMENSGLQPTKIEPTVDDKLTVFKTCLVSNVPCQYILGGVTADKNSCQNKSKTCHFIKASDFKEAEDFGVSPLRSCKSCLKREECSHKNSHMSFKEQQELSRIEENLDYNEKTMNWVAKYPLTESPEEVQGTYNGAEKCLASLVEKPGATTPLRVVTNSSFKSRRTQKAMNDILVKGPSSLNNLYHILLKFRSYGVGMTGDVNSFTTGLK